MKDDFYRRPLGDFEKKYKNQKSDNYYDDPQNDSYEPYLTPNEEITVKEHFSKTGLSIFLFHVISYFVAILAQIAIPIIFSENSESVFSSVYTTWVLNVVSMYLFAFPVTYLVLRKLPRKALKKSNLGMDEFFLFFLIAQGVMMMGNLIGISLNSAISSSLGKPIDNSVSDLIHESPLWVIFAVAVIIGPIVEEVIFRKLIIDRLSTFGSLTAVTASSLIFGLFHGNFYQFFYATGIGFVLGYIYAKTGKLRYTVALHMIINFLGSVLAIPIGEIMEEFIVLSEAVALGESVDISRYIFCSNIVAGYTVVEYGMALAGIVILVKKIGSHSIYLSNDGEIRIPKNSAFRLTVINLGVILFLISSLIQFALNIFVA